MDLWIRSQDREILTKANSLWLLDNQIWMEVPFYENHKKLGLTVGGHNYRLAQYKTKERALEVLDEIQKLLEPEYDSYNAITGKNNNGYFFSEAIRKARPQPATLIYEMPKE